MSNSRAGRRTQLIVIFSVGESKRRSRDCLCPACYECHAKTVKLADMTIGDFWGIDKISPEMDDNQGVSLVIIRTQAGAEAFVGIKEELMYQQVEYIKNQLTEDQVADQIGLKEFVDPFTGRENKKA